MTPREIDSAPTPVLSWQELLRHARNSRCEIRAAMQQNFSKFTLSKTDNGCKIYALGNPLNSTTQTLLSVDVPLNRLQNLNESSPQQNQPETLYLQPVFQQDPFRISTPSAEFSLMCERQRSNVVHGVTSYTTNGENMLLLSGDQIYRYSMSTNLLECLNIGQEIAENSEGMDLDPFPNEFGSRGCSAETPPPPPPRNASNSKLIGSPSASISTAPQSLNFVSEAKLCPIDETIVAYVLNKQVFIEKSGKVIYRTTSDRYITNGVPSYIALEELERFEGIWWSPKERRLLYERVDETEVEEAEFVINGTSPTTPMKYPRVGTKNAKSTLRMLIIDEEKVYDIGLNIDFRTKFAAFEYITRAGFFSDGKTVWTQLMSRKQSNALLMLVPETDFDLPEKIRNELPNGKLDDSQSLFMGECDYGTWNESTTCPPLGNPLKTSEIVHLCKSDHWINVHNAIMPLTVENENNPSYQFTYCQEMENGSVLELVSSKLDPKGTCFHIEEFELMEATHSLCKAIQTEVDEKRKLVYYVANESHPTEWNVCVSYYGDLKRITAKRLTEKNMSFRSERSNPKLAIDFDVGFVCWMTSKEVRATCRFYMFQFVDGQTMPNAIFVAQIALAGLSPPVELRVEVPEIIEYKSPSTGFTHYGIIMRPPRYDPNKKYPVLHYVYGGPGIQLVHNDFCSWVPFIKYTKLGYVVVMIDNRGSANRGMKFENHISSRLGGVEVQDQVEGLHILAQRSGGIMDLSRVIVHGWSYGGYMSLLLLANHSKVYRAAIAGGAVVDWKLYDTAYTERYMGYPINDVVYHESSILRIVDALPDAPDRLMVVHGLMDENVHFSHTCALLDACYKKGKMVDLVIFPKERHGIRNAETAGYLDARMLYFMQKALTSPSTEEW